MPMPACEFSLLSFMPRSGVVGASDYRRRRLGFDAEGKNKERHAT